MVEIEIDDEEAWVDAGKAGIDDGKAFFDDEEAGIDDGEAVVYDEDVVIDDVGLLVLYVAGEAACISIEVVFHPLPLPHNQ